MNTRGNHPWEAGGDDDIHANAALYAVDALEPGERQTFEAHLSRCAPCREDVAAFGEVGGRLAAAAAAEPPPQLREDVLAAVRGTRPDAAATGEPGPGAGDHAGPAEPSGAAVVSLAGRRRPRTRWLAAAAAAVLVPGAALGGWVLGAQTEQREQQQVLAQEQERQNRLLGAPDVRTHRLEVDGNPATLVVSEQEDAAMFVASGLPGPGEDQEYQLWLMQDDTPVPDVHFGGGQVRVWLEGDVRQAEAVAMTVEPAGGSEAPTLPVLTAAEI
ncbi:anti-sigma factor domain-containing protein [Kocuria sp. M1R5S2]|uniref:anti-sigma factor n=1 Tax=Kocuria rhizosphaerae TaxID=3376285 RepID=UPI0037A14478